MQLKHLSKNNSSKDYYKKYLEDICFESEFIDNVTEISEKIDKETPDSIPFGALVNGQIVGFFTIELSNPTVNFKEEDFSCWMDSFHIAEIHHGKGYAKDILKMLPKILRKEYKYLKLLNLTVNLRNKAAISLYLKCGFSDTGEIYKGGPAGPQHIFTKNINKGNYERD
ncbi:MAG: GNAT family N-acetyltransferase [Desulfobacterales bacterium]|nr:GNAT family N-acetyltransferase [Desulfobacterales bacterium]MCP4161935.1 GNAT family N-acetyltransferase [Deltaproteobacteria bacterium]